MSEKTERQTLLRRLGWSDALIDACLAAREYDEVAEPDVPALVIADVATADLVVTAAPSAWSALSADEELGLR